MTSFRFGASFECAPHATRSIALALALSLNLTLVLFALRPHTPYEPHAPPSPSLLATLLQPAPAPAPASPVPILRAVQHVAMPTVPRAVMHPLPLATPVLPMIAPMGSIRTVAATSVEAVQAGTAGDADATIAYETATAPSYPIAALRAGIQGTVLLKVLVDPRGRPIQVVVEHGSGSRILDDAARRHVLAAWRFHPAVRDGHAIEAWALVPVHFELDRG
ncbi:MAG TPA: energy transducer TonB [Rhodanobacteraceae bacterium]|jgi:protein TonB|nr:energy transducer TonB [Rhodanobacteraceae bacterium]